MKFMLVLYVLVCFSLIFLVMIQNGSAFGSPGGASSIFFGSSADNVVTKMTSVVAFCFIVGTMCLSVLSSDRASVVEREAKQILEEMMLMKQHEAAPTSVPKDIKIKKDSTKLESKIQEKKLEEEEPKEPVSKIEEKELEEKHSKELESKIEKKNNSKKRKVKKEKKAKE